MMHGGKKFFFATLVAIVVILWMIVSAEPQKTETGFFWPTGTSAKVTTAFLAAGAKEYFDGYYHTGCDLKKNVNDSIYAICDSDLDYISHDYKNWGEGNVGLIYQGQLVDGTTFHITYGHVQESSISSNKKIKAGQYIGKIGYYSKGTHLHLSICISKDAPKTNLGMAPIPDNWDGDKSKLDTLGFVDPIEFIKTKKPKNSGQINITVDQPILEKPIKLPNTGSESLPDYTNCQLTASWDIKNATGAYNDQVFYMACDFKDRLWVAGERGLVVFDQKGNCIRYFTSLNIYNSDFGLNRVHAISTFQEKIIMLADLSYDNKNYIKLLRFDLSTNPFNVYYVGNESDLGREQGKFFGLGYGSCSAISPLTGEIYIIDRLPFGTLQTSTGNTSVRLQKFSTTGLFLWAKDVAPYLEFPIGAGCDKKGNLIVADNPLSIIAKFDADGNLIEKYNLFIRPGAMCIDKFGRVNIAMGGGGTGNAELQIFSVDMNEITKYQLPLTGNIAIEKMSVDSEGNLYFGSWTGDIYKVAPVE